MNTPVQPVRIGYADEVFGRPRFEEIASRRHYPHELRQIMLAYRLAKHGHNGQQRIDRSKYFDHPKSSALILMLEFRIFLAVATICTLLHDIKEDAYILTWDDIFEVFGPDVYRGVRILTKEEGKDYWWGIQTAEWWIQLVKLADRLHNIRTAVVLADPEERRIRLEETESKYFDLITIFKRTIPLRYHHLNLPQYIHDEYVYACNRLRESLGMPTVERSLGRARDLPFSDEVKIFIARLPHQLKPPLVFLRRVLVPVYRR